jgi:type II secretory pathway component PulF
MNNMKKSKPKNIFHSTLDGVKRKSKAIFSSSYKKIGRGTKSKTPLKINTRISQSWKGLSSISYTRMSIKDQSFFIKRLSFLIKAGIPILESLVMIREQTRRKGYGTILDSVIADVSRGQYLSTGLGKFRKMFGDFSINIISFGETAGILSENLEYLADELQKKDALRKKIVSAFIYPAIVTMATFAITGFLMLYLFPKILPVFSSLRITLPLSTRMVMYFSNFLQHHWLTLISIIFVLIVSIIIAVKKSKIFAFYFDKTILKLPLVGNMIQSYNLANTTRTLGLLLKSGVTLSEALPITARVCGNLVYVNELEKLSDIINRGEKMSVYLSKNRNLFPDVLTQIISVGEKSGNLSRSLIYLSELYEAEVEDFTKNLSSLIEPVMMIVMGIMVGFIAISIITPIYSITQNLSVK